MNLILQILLVVLVFSRSSNCTDQNVSGCGVDDELLLTRTALLENNLWPNARVPYEIDSSFREKDYVVFQKAIADIHRRTCIRFMRKTSQDKAFVRAKINFESKLCGGAIPCYTGHYQYIEAAPSCSNIETWVHELGHALCLSHEQSRPDRDEYLDVSKCTKKPPIQGVRRSGLYDYNSQLHYGCSGCFKPWTEHVKKCGDQVNKEGLSVLDADKLNEYYDCGGCHRHRWFNGENLQNSQLPLLVNFARNEGDTQPVYLCRAYSKGDIAVGQYIHSNKSCNVATFSFLDVNEVRKNFEIFGLTKGPVTIPLSTESSTGYRFFMTQKFFPNNPDRQFYVPVGRTRKNVEIYATMWEFDGENGKKETYMGRVDANALNAAWFPTYKNKISDEFYIMGCSD